MARELRRDGAWEKEAVENYERVARSYLPDRVNFSLKA
jgi:hypothetical protein